MGPELWNQLPGEGQAERKLTQLSSSRSGPPRGRGGIWWLPCPQEQTRAHAQQAPRERVRERNLVNFPELPLVKEIHGKINNWARWFGNVQIFTFSGWKTDEPTRQMPQIYVPCSPGLGPGDFFFPPSQSCSSDPPTASHSKHPLHDFHRALWPEMAGDSGPRSF